MKLDRFNELDNKSKVTYLLECLNSIDKDKDESWDDYELRLVQWKKDSDVDLPEAENMRYMLSLLKKYNKMRTRDLRLIENEPSLLNPLLNEYITYVRDNKLEKLV